MVDIDPVALARRLPFSQQEWLQRYDDGDPEWCPPRLAMAFLRIGLIEADHLAGGYRFTKLGTAVRAELAKS